MAYAGSSNSRSCHRRTSLEFLQAPVRENIRSGTNITSAAQCVKELVRNALDANSTCIAVQVNLPQGEIQVVDNGVGMNSKQLDLIGNRYVTSRSEVGKPSAGAFGYRGETLASLACLCQRLELTSRRRGDEEQTWRRLLGRMGAAPADRAPQRRPSAGTTVTVQGLRAGKRSRRRPLELERVRDVLETLALPHPGVSFSLRDDTTGRILMDVARRDTVLQRYCDLAEADLEKAQTRSLTARSGAIRVKGLTTPADSRQWVFINRRAAGRGRIHSLAARLLASLQPNPGTTSPPGRCGFVLLISCPVDQCSVIYDPDEDRIEFTDWESVLTTVERAIVDAVTVRPVESVATKVATVATAPSATTDGLPDAQSVAQPPAEPAACFMDRAEARRGKKVARPNSATGRSCKTNRSEMVQEGDQMLSEAETVTGDRDIIRVQEVQTTPNEMTACGNDAHLAEKEPQRAVSGQRKSACPLRDVTSECMGNPGLQNHGGCQPDDEYRYHGKKCLEIRTLAETSKKDSLSQKHSVSRYQSNSYSGNQRADGRGTENSTSMRPQVNKQYRGGLDLFRQTVLQAAETKKNNPESMSFKNAFSTPSNVHCCTPTTPPPVKRPRLVDSPVPSQTISKRKLSGNRQSLAELFKAGAPSSPLEIVPAIKHLDRKTRDEATSRSTQSRREMDGGVATLSGTEAELLNLMPPPPRPPRRSQLGPDKIAPRNEVTQAVQPVFKVPFLLTATEKICRRDRSLQTADSYGQNLERYPEMGLRVELFPRDDATCVHRDGQALCRLLDPALEQSSKKTNTANQRLSTKEPELTMNNSFVTGIPVSGENSFDLQPVLLSNSKQSESLSKANNLEVPVADSSFDLNPIQSVGEMEITTNDSFTIVPVLRENEQQSRVDAISRLSRADIERGMNSIRKFLSGRTSRSSGLVSQLSDGDVTVAFTHFLSVLQDARLFFNDEQFPVSRGDFNDALVKMVSLISSSSAAAAADGIASGRMITDRRSGIDHLITGGLDSVSSVDASFALAPILSVVPPLCETSAPISTSKPSDVQSSFMIRDSYHPSATPGITASIPEPKSATLYSGGSNDDASATMPPFRRPSPTQPFDVVDPGEATDQVQQRPPLAASTPVGPESRFACLNGGQNETCSSHIGTEAADKPSLLNVTESGLSGACFVLDETNCSISGTENSSAEIVSGSVNADYFGSDNRTVNAPSNMEKDRHENIGFNGRDNSGRKCVETERGDIDQTDVSQPGFPSANDGMQRATSWRELAGKETDRGQRSKGHVTKRVKLTQDFFLRVSPQDTAFSSLSELNSDPNPHLVADGNVQMKARPCADPNSRAPQSDSVEESQYPECGITDQYQKNGPVVTGKRQHGSEETVLIQNVPDTDDNDEVTTACEHQLKRILTPAKIGNNEISASEPSRPLQFRASGNSSISEILLSQHVRENQPHASNPCAISARGSNTGSELPDSLQLLALDGCPDRNVVTENISSTDAISRRHEHVKVTERMGESECSHQADAIADIEDAVTVSAEGDSLFVSGVVGKHCKTMSEFGTEKGASENFEVSLLEKFNRSQPLVKVHKCLLTQQSAAQKNAQAMMNDSSFDDVPMDFTEQQAMDAEDSMERAPGHALNRGAKFSHQAGANADFKDAVTHSVEGDSLCSSGVVAIPCKGVTELCEENDIPEDFVALMPENLNRGQSLAKGSKGSPVQLSETEKNAQVMMDDSIFDDISITFSGEQAIDEVDNLKHTPVCALESKQAIDREEVTGNKTHKPESLVTPAQLTVASVPTSSTPVQLQTNSSAITTTTTILPTITCRPPSPPAPEPPSPPSPAPEACPAAWRRLTDPSGRAVFVSSASGLTSLRTPPAAAPPAGAASRAVRPLVVTVTDEPRRWWWPPARPLLLTHGFSPFLPRGRLRPPRRLAAAGQLQLPSAGTDSAGGQTGDVSEGRLVVGQRAQQYTEPAMFERPIATLGTGSSEICRPQTCDITTDMLSNVQVFKQLDNKFIAGCCGDVLLLFDQHAVSERINLENILKEAFTSAGSERLRSEQLSPPLQLQLPGRLLRLLAAHPEPVHRLGFLLGDLHNDSNTETSARPASSAAAGWLVVTAAPVCLAAAAADRGWTERRAAAVLAELAEQLASSGGAAAALPRALMDVYCSMACHSAVRFGDPLTREACVALLTELAGCRLPLQCAHGRPTVVPLVDCSRLPAAQQEAPPRLARLRRRAR